MTVGRTLKWVGLAIFTRWLSMSATAQITATATALVSRAGSVTNVQVVQGGSGYFEVPLVTFGGGGHGASAIAELSFGVVTSITVVSGGSGYTNTPSVTVAAPSATLDQGLVGLYPFNGSADDLSGSGNPGTVYGRGQYVSDRFGNAMSALSFNGQGDYVMCGKGLADLESASVSFWVKLESWVGYQSVFFDGDATPGKDFALFFEGSPSFVVRSDDNTGVNDWMPPVGAWTHFVTVANASTHRLELWVNGQALRSGGFSPGTLGATKGYHSNLYFGARAEYDDWFFHGALDDVRIYNHPLTHAEIQELYTRELGKTFDVGISIASVALTLNLDPGTTNQLEGSSDLIGWSSIGAPFVATNAVSAQIVPTTSGVKYFRVLQVP